MTVSPTATFGHADGRAQAPVPCPVGGTVVAIQPATYKQMPCCKPLPMSNSLGKPPAGSSEMPDGTNIWALTHGVL